MLMHAHVYAWHQHANTFVVLQFGLLGGFHNEVLENEALTSVCVGLKPPDNNTHCAVNFSLTLHVSITGYTAGNVLSSLICGLFLPYFTLIPVDPASDYIANSTDLIFDRCSLEQCVAITLINDETLELNETFVISLERTAGLDERIRLVDTLKVVAIIDDDVDGM